MVQRYENNKYRLRLSKKKIRIPKELAPKIANNKQLLKVCSIYLELKPLYYNSLIKDYRSHYTELAAYLGLGISTLRQYINRLEGLGLVKKDGKHLVLCSWHTFRELFSIETRKIHKVDNGYQMGLILRVLAINYNLETQKYKFWRKFFIEDQYSRYCESELAKFRTQGQKIYLETKERFARDLLYKIDKNKAWKSVFKKFCEDPYNLHKATQGALKELEAGKNIPTFNPSFTLSCRGVARIFGNKTPGAGFYWERKLEDLNLLLIQNISIRSTANANLRQNLEGYSLGIYSKTTSKLKKRVYFQTLSNHLCPVIPE